MSQPDPPRQPRQPRRLGGMDDLTAAIPQYRPEPRPSPQTSRNGFGITALVLAIIGLVFGLIPFTGFIALILGLLAVLFGLLGLGRVRRWVANNKVMSIVGTLLGVVSTALGIWGIVIVFGAVDQLSRDLSSAPIVQTDPAAGEVAAATFAFGETVTFTSGVAITVGVPVGYEPTEFAAMNENAERAMRMSVTITNGSAEALDYLPSLMVSHGGNAVTGVYDSGNGLVDPPTTSLLPGDSTTFDAVFGIGADVADVQVEWRDGFIGDPAIYVGSF